MDIAAFKKFLTLHSQNCSYTNVDTTVLPPANIIQHIIDSQNIFFCELNCVVSKMNTED